MHFYEHIGRWGSIFLLALAASGTARAVDPTALLAGAHTEVTQKDASGRTWKFRTRITGVRYHIPGVSSEVAMSDTPIPVLRTEDGVSFYEVTGELSGVAFHYHALPQVDPVTGEPTGDYKDLYSVYGPIGPDGVDHRNDPAGSNVRAGLPGIPFVLRWPAQGWNGGLVQYETGGGGGQPSFIYWPFIDLPALLRAGWAYFSIHAGGTVGDDTNPNGTGAFWKLADGYFINSAPSRSYFRFAQVGPDGSESAFASTTLLRVWFTIGPGQGILGGLQGIYFDLPVGDIEGLDARFTTTVGRPLSYMQHVPAPEVYRDAVRFAKNLLRAETRTKGRIWTCWLGHSDGGGVGLMIDLGRRGWDTEATVRQGPPRTGGNYNDPFDPSSGVRYDAFLLQAAYPAVGYAPDPEYPNDPSPYWWHHDFVPDDEYPISAPTVWVVGDTDLVAPPTYATEVAAAIDARLPGSALADKHLGDWLSIYTVRGLNHLTADDAFSALPGDSNPAGSALYFDDDVGLNYDGIGDRVAAGVARMVEANWDRFEADDSWLRDLDHAPRSTGMYLQLLQDLRDRTEHGTPLPTSRLEGRLFDDPDAIGIGTPYVRYAMPCDDSVDESYPDVLACAATITEDSASDFGEQPWLALDATGVAATRQLATGTLDYTTEPLSLPGYTTALGPYLFVFQGALLHRLTDAQLEQGYTATDGRLYHYADHEDYVSAYTQAIDELVEERLYDPEMAAEAISSAAASDALVGGQ